MKIYECLNCHKSVFRKLWQIEPSGRVFCSKSCAATYNNSHNKSRKFGPAKSKKCKYCDNIVGSKKSSVCPECRETHPAVVLDISLTIQDIKQHHGFKSNRFSRVRGHARRVLKKAGGLVKCLMCGYSKHVEACHIVPISKWAATTTISKVNSLNNLVGLCKNCHWELDHGILSKKKIREKMKKKLTKSSS